MKFFLSILLLLITAFYVLPLKDILKETESICITDLEELKEESIKKEKVKELFSFTRAYIIANDSYSSTHQYVTFILPVLVHTIEIPPPDLL